MRTCSLVVLGSVIALCLAPRGPGQRQFEDLIRRYLPADREHTYALAVGDVDGDGVLDLVVGNADSENRLYLGDGTGAFVDATATRLPAGLDETHALALGDVDGDGDLDLVAGNSSFLFFKRQNRLYLNDGAGTFTDVTAARMPQDSDETQALALEDFDGDGDLDLVLGNGFYGSNAGQSRLYLNDGTGTFTDATATRMPQVMYHTHALAVGDVDGDGDADLLLGNALHGGGEQNRLYVNDGTGTFTDATATRLPQGTDSTMALALEDVDGDGDADFVAGNGYGYNNAMQRNRLYLNDGTGRFTDASSRMPGAVGWTRAVVLGDLDGDGDADIALANAASSRGINGGQNWLYLNDGTGTFTDATAAAMPVALAEPRAVVLEDLDGDGDSDLVFGNREQNRLYLNDGMGIFTNASAARIPMAKPGTRAVALGDVDGDGDQDLVLGDFGENRLYVNDGTGTFVDESARLPRGFTVTEAALLADVDGDGDPDLVLGNNGQNHLYVNDGTGRFADVTAARMPVDFDDTVSLAAGDVDGDGDPDLVLGNHGLGYYGSRLQNRLYLNDGTGSFTDVTAARMPVDSDWTTAVALGDVDADGDLDLVLGNRTNYVSRGQNRLYLNDGAGTFTDVTAARMPLPWENTEVLALGDVDGDGDLDLVCGNADKLAIPQQSRLYVNDGSGTFTDVTLVRMPPDQDCTFAVALGDLDGDGHPDLVLGNDGQNRLYLNDGRGTFTDATAARIPVDWDTTLALALEDVDQDGDLDVVLGNSYTPSRLYTNLHRELRTPFFPIRSRPYALEFRARPGYAQSAHTGVAVLAFALLPVPVSIPGLGTFFLAPVPSFAMPPVAIPRATGAATQRLSVPSNPSLVGIALHFQGLIVDHATSQAHLTGYTADAIR